MYTSRFPRAGDPDAEAEAQTGQAGRQQAERLGVGSSGGAWTEARGNQEKKHASCTGASLGRAEAGVAGRGAEAHGTLPWTWPTLGPPVRTPTPAPCLGEHEAVCRGGTHPAASF